MKKKKEKDYFIEEINQFVFEPIIGACEFRDITILYSVDKLDGLITLLDFKSDGKYWDFLKRYIDVALPEKKFFKKTYISRDPLSVSKTSLDDIDDDDGAKLLFELNYK